MLIVHANEVQSLVGHAESLLVLLDIAGHFLGLFADSRLGLVLVLLQYLLFAFGRVAVDRGTDLQLLLVKSHDVVVVGYVLFEEGILMILISGYGIGAFDWLEDWVFEYPALAGVLDVLVHPAGELVVALLGL